MINNPLPFKSLNIRIPSTIPIKGMVFINQGSALNLAHVSVVDLQQSDDRKHDTKYQSQSKLAITQTSPVLQGFSGA